MKNMRHKIDLNAPDGLARLFAANRALFGDATMRTNPDAPAEQDPAPTDPAPTDPPAPSTTDEDALGEAGKRALKAERDAAAREKARADAAEKRLQEIEDQKLSDVDRAKKEAQAAADEARDLRLENVKLRAIAAHNVPADYQDLVNGTDAASFESSAKRIAELASKAAGSPKGPDPVPEQGGGTKDKDKSGGSVQAGIDLYNAKHKKP